MLSSREKMNTVHIYAYQNTHWGIIFFRAAKSPQETFDGAAAIRYYFFVNIPKVGSYQIATVTF